MPRVQTNGIEIEYDTFGEPEDRPLILIMGLRCQLVAWPESFCKKLATKGHFVIRFDNRDVGLSTKFDDLGVPDIFKLFAAAQESKAIESAYSLSEMAADTVGLMDALNLEKAHVCGLSMGGMIAQMMATEHPRRVISLISMQSSTGDPGLPEAEPQAREAMVAPPPIERDAYIQHMVDVYRAFAGGSDKYDERLQKEISASSYDRSFYLMGFTRQLAAILACGSRKDALAAIDVPTLVIHGSHDTLLPPAHGKDTAEAVPGAKLVIIKGLGHGMAYPVLWDEIIETITAHTTNVI
ncbi:MAG: alpha/beta hydrolase [Desulfobacterales bacterium]|nr:MAG: alpha/beta hydrolase [Desulfobacterales bacterium]